MTRVYVRKFDWERARQLRAAGRTVTSIAAEFGVSTAAIVKATDEDRHEETRW